MGSNRTLAFVQKFEILRIKEDSHPLDGSRIFLVQIAVDGVPCMPFWTHVAERRAKGEEAWLEGLKENAVDMVARFGRQPALA